MGSGQQGRIGDGRLRRMRTDLTLRTVRTRGTVVLFYLGRRIVNAAELSMCDPDASFQLGFLGVVQDFLREGEEDLNSTVRVDVGKKTRPFFCVAVGGMETGGENVARCCFS